MITAMVPTARNAAVSELSCWVTPCCTRSPMITSMTNSKADMPESSFFPMALSTMKRNRYVSAARRTVSI